MSQRSQYAIIEDFDEKENENSYLLQKEPSSAPFFSKEGLMNFFNTCYHGNEDRKSISEEEFGDELEQPVSKEKEDAVRDGIHTFALLVLALVAIGVCLIYLSFVLVPLVLSWFFVYVFQPFINYMVGKKTIFGMHLRLPRPIAVIVCAICVLVLLVLLGLIIYFSVLEIVKNSEKYITHLNELYASLIALAEESGFGDDLSSLLPEIQFGDIIVELLSTLANDILPQGVLCLLFTMYMLLDYNEKKTKTPLERQIDGQIRKYIIIKILISLVTGVLVSIILRIFSVDMWLLFGLLTFLFNFIPNIGSMIAALLPMPIAILDPNQTWITIILIFLIPVSIHFVIGNFVEPKVMGKSFEMTAVAVLVCLAFWGAVWGIVGAFMSVPLTVVLHLWLRTIPHPMARFLAGLLAGEFKWFSIADQIESHDKELKEV